MWQQEVELFVCVGALSLLGALLGWLILLCKRNRCFYSSSVIFEPCSLALWSPVRGVWEGKGVVPAYLPSPEQLC